MLKYKTGISAEIYRNENDPVDYLSSVFSYNREKTSNRITMFYGIG